MKIIGGLYVGGRVVLSSFLALVAIIVGFFAVVMVPHQNIAFATELTPEITSLETSAPCDGDDCTSSYYKYQSGPLPLSESI